MQLDGINAVGLSFFVSSSGGTTKVKVNTPPKAALSRLLPDPDSMQGAVDPLTTNWEDVKPTWSLQEEFKLNVDLRNRVPDIDVIAAEVDTKSKVLRLEAQAQPLAVLLDDNELQ